MSKTSRREFLAAAVGVAVSPLAVLGFRSKKKVIFCNNGKYRLYRSPNLKIHSDEDISSAQQVAFSNGIFPEIKFHQASLVIKPSDPNTLLKPRIDTHPLF